MNKQNTDDIKQGVNKLSKGFEFNYKLLIAIAAGLTPVAYLIGYAFHQGTLSAYGVSSDMFIISTYMTYVNSYFAVGSLINEISSFALKCIIAVFSSPFLSLGIVIFVVLTWASYKKIRKWAVWGKVSGALQNLASKLSVVWAKSEVLKAALIGGLASYVLYAVLTILIAVTVLWWGAPSTAYKLGYHDSHQKIKEYKDTGCCPVSSNGFSKCRALIDSNGKELLRGLMVANSSKFIAFYNEKGATVQEFPKGAKLKSLRMASICKNSINDRNPN